MAHQGFGGVLDTPQSTFGDATYLSRQPDFADISQEASFLSPEKDGDLFQQLRNGGRSNGINIRTPRQRAALADRRNLPSNIGGGEFTPLLKSATRNSTRRNGKENNATVPATPAALRTLLEEDEMTPLPRMDGSAFSTRNASFLGNDLPQIASSASTTPMGPPPRRNIIDKGPLQDGNQLSLREQENVIDKIEKENFGLKLKIHFLEEALRKAGPGFSEAALKENTELKVDKVTMQRELHKYKKEITTAERELESYRQQMLELREKAEQKYANKDQQAELDTLRETIQARESAIEELRSQASNSQDHQERVETLENNVVDLEAELREKDRLLTEREDELEDLRDKLNEAENAVAEHDANTNEEEMEEALATIRDLRSAVRDWENKADNLQETVRELEGKAENLQQAARNWENKSETLQQTARNWEGKAENLQQTVRNWEGKAEILQQTARDWENKAEQMKERMNSALSQKVKAEAALDELQEEMANKSIMTKGLSRQIEEKVSRLQEELRQSSEEYIALEREAAELSQENDELKATVQEQLSLLEDAAQSQEEALEQDVLQQQELIDEMVASEAVLRQELERERRSLERKQQSHVDNTKQSQRLLKSQAEVENLEHDIIEQQELINNLVASEAVLRAKLERARTERAAYRMSVEKMQNDIQHLKKEAAAGAQKLSRRYGYADNEALDTIVRASEGAQVRHKKELRGMMLQMEWMQARWEREASLRSDAAYAKKFLQLQLNIAHACNKAQLRELEHIRTKVLQSRKPLALPKPPSFSSSSGSSPNLKTFLVMARFIARTRIAARNWAGQEAVRQKLRTAIEEKRQIKRSKQLKVVAADVY
ncbi:hypothetical protein LI328DRAFT_154546 [Trichoderma asperelloides]|nr:hypothetical protein LI328DRAFT_154546 [Trichoderma asperelloides]